MMIKGKLGFRQREAITLLEELGESITREIANKGVSTPKQMQNAMKRLEDRGIVSSRKMPDSDNPNAKLWRLAE